MSNFDHFIEHIVDKSKKQLEQTVLDETINVHNRFTTLERYPVNKLLVLYDYLEDLSIENPLVQGRDLLFAKNTESTINGRIHTQMKVIEKLLNLPDDIPQRVVDNQLHIINAYGYKTHHHKGRIYGYKNTMTLISRQCRYYLFKGLYFDIDLKNAHPTILLTYAKENGIEAKTLERYVTNREGFLQSVVDRDNLTRNDAKTSVLRCLNLVSDISLTSSLKELHRDILPIRNHLYKSNILDSVTPLGEYTMSRDSFVGKSLEKQKISLQSQYCATEESRSLNVLYEVCLRKGLLNREATFRRNSRNISFIPFFDGAYVYFEGLKGDFEITQILEDTNELIAPYTFELKEIKPEWDFIDEERLKNYEIIKIFLSSLSEKEYINMLQILNIPTFSLDQEKLKEIDLYASLKTQAKASEDSKTQKNPDKWFDGCDLYLQNYIRECVKQHKYKIRQELLSRIDNETFEDLKNELKIKGTF